MSLGMRTALYALAAILATGVFAGGFAYLLNGGPLMGMLLGLLAGHAAAPAVLYYAEKHHYGWPS